MGKYILPYPTHFSLRKRKKILNFEVSKFVSLGTPKDYHEYLNWQNFFQLKTHSKNL